MQLLKRPERRPLRARLSISMRYHPRARSWAPSRGVFESIGDGHTYEGFSLEAVGHARPPGLAYGVAEQAPMSRAFTKLGTFRSESRISTLGTGARLPEGEGAHHAVEVAPAEIMAARKAWPF
jgi:hypothetical protein